VTDAHHEDKQEVVADLVDDSIVSCRDAIQVVGAPQFFSLRGMRIRP